MPYSRKLEKVTRIIIFYFEQACWEMHERLFLYWRRIEFEIQKNLAAIDMCTSCILTKCFNILCFPLDSQNELFPLKAYLSQIISFVRISQINTRIQVALFPNIFYDLCKVLPSNFFRQFSKSFIEVTAITFL